METTISIEKILEKRANDGRKYYVLRSNQGGFFLWREQLPEGVSEGQQVWISYRDGKYPRITEVKPVSGEEATDEAATAVSTNERVLRSVALKAAAHIYSNREADGEEILQAADRFFQWLSQKLGP